MEVTKHNIDQAIEEIGKLLQNTDFVSFDSEFSGLGPNVGGKKHELDTTFERYEKLSRRVREYGLIQIGISLFRFCNKTEKYMHASYCFYLCGEPNGSYSYDASSMTFLASHGFDFNKLFKDGLSFISVAEEKKLLDKKEEIVQRQIDDANCNPVKIREEKALNFYKSAKARVQDSMKDKKGENLIFPGKELSPLFRKILFNNVAPEFPKTLFRSLRAPSYAVEVIHFDSRDEIKPYLSIKYEEDVKKKLGFTSVVKLILDSGKPMVGHNLILDLLQFVHKFVSPLPADIQDFRTLVAANLPTIYDTKLLSKDPPFCTEITNTALASLYEGLVVDFNPPEFDTEEGHSSYNLRDSEGLAHNAGFDAFMTGVCFIVMLKHLAGGKRSKKNLLSSSHLKNYANKVNFMGSYDMPYMSVKKPDLMPDRRYIYKVVCPSTWTSASIHKVFSVLKTYKVVWVTDTQLFVIPLEKSDVSKPGAQLATIRSLCPPNTKVSMYKEPKSSTSPNGANLVKSSVSSAAKVATKRSPDDSSEDSSTSGAHAEGARDLKRIKSVGQVFMPLLLLLSVLVCAVALNFFCFDQFRTGLNFYRP